MFGIQLPKYPDSMVTQPPTSPASWLLQRYELQLAVGGNPTMNDEAERRCEQREGASARDNGLWSCRELRSLPQRFSKLAKTVVLPPSNPGL